MMLYLYIQAPFAVFRSFTAGSFRPTASFMTHSAAYGLLLNVAGIEMRFDDGKSPMTLIKDELPPVRLALGALGLPHQHTVYQQMHNYPVGSTGKEHAPFTKGSKYNIAPVRRAILSDLKACISVDGNNELETWIREGLDGKRQRAYGLPFMGDNNFLIDRLELLDKPKPAYWFERIDEEDQEGLVENVTRLTITIDRKEMSRTRSMLFAPTKEKTSDIPQKAWVKVYYPYESQLHKET